MDSEGSRRLILAAAEKGAAECRGKRLPPADVERRRRTNRELELWRNLRPAGGRRLWTAADVALLGKEPDDVLAARLRRTVEAVRVQRGKRGSPTARGRRRRPASGRQKLDRAPP
jgi:hypothetical protein